MEKMNGNSMDITAQNIEKLKELFPNVVTEGKIDFDALKIMMGGVIDSSKEKYQFTWNGKADSIKLAQSPSSATLRPCKKKSKNWDTTENIYIEGDNLEVLKQLQKTYYGKIKMIYIDPPYNTGNDFVYKDDFKDSIKNYKEQTGQTQKSNPETSGRYHSDWLNMIYSRLILARNLLSDDGVIFISIDDNEVDNLKKICNEIFGEENFKTVFSRVTKKGGKSSSEVAKNHDFLLMYVKNTELADLKGIAHTDEGYCKRDEFFEQRGYYKANQTLDYDSLGYVKTLDYPIEIDGETFYAGGTKADYEKRQNGQHGRADWGWRWRWSKELFDFGLKNGFIEVHKGGERSRIYTKTYEKVTIDRSGDEYKIVVFDRTKPLSTLEFTENEYSNDNAKKIFDSLMGKGIFEYTKTPEMIKTLQNLVTTKDFIILDFFSGSATTAHAVMQLNSEDGGKRKFIMVQLPEICAENTEAYKAGYKTICDIGEERIRRAGEKIKEEWQQKKEKNNLFEDPEKFPVDIGFKVFKLDSTNINPWDNTEQYDEESIFKTVSVFKNNRSKEDILYEIMLKYGVFDQKVSEISVNGKTMYRVGHRHMIICLEDNIDDKDIQEIGRLEPRVVVFKEDGFKDDNAKINAEYNLRKAGVEDIKAI